MMLLLSKREYDDLVKRAGNLDQVLEERVKTERERILSQLRAGIVQKKFQFGHDPEKVIVHLLDELSR